MGILDDKVAVVIGATSGIGAAVARQFVSAGAQVVLAGRRTDVGDRLAAELGDAARFRRVDASVEDDVRGLLEEAVQQHGKLDILVNSAGVPGHWADIADIDLQEFRQVMDVHFYGVLHGLKHAARQMIAQGSGSIINVVSTSGIVGGWSGPDYSAAKAGVLQLTRSAAVELGESGVRVNSVTAGVVLTGIFGKGAGLDPAVADRTASGLAAVFPAMMGHYQPVQRPIMPTDVAEAVTWLASDASSLVNGHSLVVDGGVAAGRPISVSRGERAQLTSLLSPNKE
ncbi:SDR family oxidoreductase [Actinoplanes sp. TBRC 11911]|nr:SDR family oxidoreductase [Actinoplanes sp. TBRC 11911]